jgi:hypothetical protein
MPHLLITLLLAVAALAIVSRAPAAPRPDPPCAHHVEGRGCQDWQWKWQVWLPDKWQRIGACETGYGKRPGRWDWNSGTYQGAFGFYHGSWDQFKPVSWWPRDAHLATPWQQYQTALAIWRRYGFSGWGCRSA